MSVTAVGPMLTIDGPLPEAPPFNLFTVAEPLRDRWLAGVNVWAYPPDAASGHDACGDGTFSVKDDAEGYDNPTFHSFSAYLPIVCSTVTRDMVGVMRRAEAALDATDHVAAEKQLVSGTYATAPYLAQVGTTLGGGFATLAPAALAYLEQAIGETGRRGVIHADPATASAFTTTGGTQVVGDQLQTLLGTPIIVGSGYIGAFPDGGQAPNTGSSYAWASGPVFADREGMVLSDNIADYLDVPINLLVYRAERNIVVGWDNQFSAAILVEWSGCCSSGEIL